MKRFATKGIAARIEDLETRFLLTASFQVVVTATNLALVPSTPLSEAPLPDALLSGTTAPSDSGPSAVSRTGSTSAGSSATGSSAAPTADDYLIERRAVLAALAADASQGAPGTSGGNSTPTSSTSSSTSGDGSTGTLPVISGGRSQTAGNQVDGKPASGSPASGSPDPKIAAKPPSAPLAEHSSSAGAGADATSLNSALDAVLTEFANRADVTQRSSDPSSTGSSAISASQVASAARDPATGGTVIKSAGTTGLSAAPSQGVPAAIPLDALPTLQMIGAGDAAAAANRLRAAADSSPLIGSVATLLSVGQSTAQDRAVAGVVAATDRIGVAIGSGSLPRSPLTALGAIASPIPGSAQPVGEPGTGGLSGPGSLFAVRTVAASSAMVRPFAEWKSSAEVDGFLRTPERSLELSPFLTIDWSGLEIQMDGIVRDLQKVDTTAFSDHAEPAKLAYLWASIMAVTTCVLEWTRRQNRFASVGGDVCGILNDRSSTRRHAANGESDYVP